MKKNVDKYVEAGRKHSSETNRTLTIGEVLHIIHRDKVDDKMSIIAEAYYLGFETAYRLIKKK